MATPACPDLSGAFNGSEAMNSALLSALDGLRPDRDDDKDEEAIAKKQRKSFWNHLTSDRTGGDGAGPQYALLGVCAHLQQCYSRQLLLLMFKPPVATKDVKSSDTTEVLPSMVNSK